MDPNHVCPYCPSPADACPHLLICVGRPGEVFAGALAERLQRLWAIIIEHVGDGPTVDQHGVYEQAWNDLIQRYALEGGVAVEGDRWGAIFLADPACMAAVIEACVPLDEL
jgi:hypothetical protein